MAPLNWSECPAVESIPGKVSGAWVFKHRSAAELTRSGPRWAMSRRLLKFSGGSVDDYATFSTAGFSQLTNHGTPNRSTT